MFASPTVLREAAAPVDTAILLVALAAREVADPELREAVPVAEEAEEPAEAMDARSVWVWVQSIVEDARLTRHCMTGGATSDSSGGRHARRGFRGRHYRRGH
jgi:hypothetical protein